MSQNSQTAYSEPQVIEGCKRGDRKFQEILYHQFTAKLYAICWRYAPNAETAQDLLQEGWIKVFNNIEKYRGDGSFEGWLKRIFVNTSIEFFRKKANNMYVVTENENIQLPTLTENAIDQLQEEDILRVIQTLSNGYRTIFNMYVIEGFTHKEIAEQLGISEGTSKSQLARAKQILQQKVIQLFDNKKNSSSTLHFN